MCHTGVRTASEVNLIQETLSVLDRETAVLVEQALS
jgi:hypothetical protein